MECIKEYCDKSLKYIINKSTDEALIRDGFVRGYVNWRCNYCNEFRPTPIDCLYYTFVNKNHETIVIAISHYDLTISKLVDTDYFPTIHAEPISDPNIMTLDGYKNIPRLNSIIRNYKSMEINIGRLLEQIERTNYDYVLFQTHNVKD